jgi:hypothetical protein
MGDRSAGIIDVAGIIDGLLSAGSSCSASASAAAASISASSCSACASAASIAEVDRRNSAGGSKT